MTILSHDAIAAAAADMLTDAAKGWELVRQMEQAGKDSTCSDVIIDGYAGDALYDETQARPNMGDLDPDDEYVMFQQDDEFYSDVECAENRPDYVGS